jgi:hypothetical protein
MPIDPIDPAQKALLDKALAVGSQAQNPAAASAANFRKMAAAVKPAVQPFVSGQPEFKHRNNPPESFNQIRDAFDNALAYHLKLSGVQRSQNSDRAVEAMRPYLGTPSGGMTPLLNQNSKTEKEASLGDGTKVRTVGLTLLPAYKEGDGVDTCVNHASCDQACLGERAGRYGMGTRKSETDPYKNVAQKAGFKRTQAFLKNPEAFITHLHNEINLQKAIAAQQGKHLGVRLNTLSDIPGSVYKSLMEAHPDVTFYDYTKSRAKPIAPNHHLTYSSSGISQPSGYNGYNEEVVNPHGNWAIMRSKMDYHPEKNPTPSNISMVFSHKSVLPSYVHDEETGKRYRVVDGNVHDFTPAHTQPEGEDGVILGLTYKDIAGPPDGRLSFEGKDKTGKTIIRNPIRDSKGFVVPYDPQWVKNASGDLVPSNHVVVIPKQPKRFSVKRGPSDEEE